MREAVSAIQDKFRHRYEVCIVRLAFHGTVSRNLVRFSCVLCASRSKKLRLPEARHTAVCVLELCKRFLWVACPLSPSYRQPLEIF